MVPGERIVVLASGEGTLLQAILDSPLSNRIVAVGSDIDGSRALERARDAGVATFCVPMQPDRAGWDRSLRDALVHSRADTVVCAGFMRILGPEVLGAFEGQIINSHPSLLPAFPGAHAVRDALAYGVRVTGCTIHLVDSGVDTGPILAQQPVFVMDDDDEPTLHERIKEIERVLLVDVVERFVDGWSDSKRRVVGSP